MVRIPSLVKSSLLALATVATLGFGAAQAFAAPQPRANEQKACSTWPCPACGPLGGVWVPKDGRCYCCG